MLDAVDLIGKTIYIGALDYKIVKVYFVPDAVTNEHSLYFGLTKSNEATIINYSYWSLLPYIKKSIKLFVQVNIGNEKQKSGIATSEVDNFVKLCVTKYKLDIIGLMCLPPIDQDPIPYFRLLKELALNNGLPDLSMGMSGDYSKAIECGSSYVRIGSAIFGERS